jgi:uncharacterized protein (DUF2249 family)/iron-sulfur cluster repair protein YtfE (RIC family)
MTVTTPQDQTIAAIYAHHQQLALAVSSASVLVTDAAERLGDCGRYRDKFVALMRDEVMPHAAAEERTLYAAGAEGERTGLLVRAMIDEHHRLAGLVDELSAARTPVSMSTAAASLRSMFDAHLVKENDILLPALVADGVDLAQMLAGMHEILGAGHDQAGHHHHSEPEPAQAQQSGGCGCGCGCGAGHGGDGAQAGDLDVRPLPHALRHEQIFGMVNQLERGQSFVLLNDHDPKPLRFQFEAQAPGQIGWEYLVQGPEIWRVRISRL